MEQLIHRLETRAKLVFGVFPLDLDLHRVCLFFGEVKINLNPFLKMYLLGVFSSSGDQPREGESRIP